jgi:cytochrome c peroxidase
MLPLAALLVGCAEREVSSPEIPSLAVAANADGLSPLEALGKAIYFDENLSVTKKQACASCHDPAWGFTGPDSDVNAHEAVYQGAINGRFGNRKPPSAAYATVSPIFHYDIGEGLFIGGNFWDGRATGEMLGNPAADQAQGPFLNPVEQALPEPFQVVKRVCKSNYADLFREVWGPDACSVEDDPGAIAAAYDMIALSIAAFEDSPEVNAFSSKFDAVMAGAADFTPLEQDGFDLFVDEEKGKCALCHVLDGDALFTDFTFDNLGVPKNPENPFYTMPEEFNPLGASWIDYGLGAFLASIGDPLAPDFMGQHKVPTLRNVDLRPNASDVKAFGHNGYFKSLKQIVHFYNTRDTKDPCPGDYTAAESMAADCWPAPEVPGNVNEDELGDLGLTDAEEDAIVAFMKTLSDGYF